ncbi:hypothetical protein K503DRAFT_869538 [Rhizopogon vinicolor AM-OR11-026]|uniref:Uncharacterized protein n=1 Tax=Rhizopogon vinicolor AM-OR11-026 TaxID=1314800 RepID=A0A1B7MLK3_9AGAM|nr:hypothetical protein K503DRAFT_869538 [Rhizopogon vinicolor AM-OR11-026]
MPIRLSLLRSELPPSHLEHDHSSATRLEAYDSSTILYPESIPPTPQQPLPPRPAHTFCPDGLLQVNLDARYPILDLIACADVDSEWNTNLTRASRTLPDAIRELSSELTAVFVPVTPRSMCSSGRMVAATGSSVPKDSLVKM